VQHCGLCGRVLLRSHATRLFVGCLSIRPLNITALRCTCSYTPLLPAVATGTIEERSIVEPVRRIMAGKGNYFEASVERILPDEQVGRGSAGGCLHAGRQGCGASQHV
jgi:hypothetical protein